MKTINSDDRKFHDLVIDLGESALIVQREKRGGLTIQVGVTRGDREEWNFITIPPRHAKKVAALLRPTPHPKTSKRTRR